MARRLMTCALLGASALAAIALPAPASAQHIDRIIAFGDSYADDGNALELAGISPGSTTVYPSGRFTGGTNFNDELALLLGVPVDNFAIGGALTNNSNTTAGLPGFTFEVNSYLAGGGGVFPMSTRTFDEGDLVTVSIGGNDARVYQRNGGSLAGAPAAAAGAVTSAAGNLDLLVNAGAPTISFLAGNTALLPEIANDPAAQAVRNAFSTAFNTGIQSVLAGYAADGVIVHYLDLTVMLQQVQANLAAYGFSNAGFCAPVASCLNAAYANEFVFYLDALHPTSRTSAVIARYIAAQVQGPLLMQAPSELTLGTAQQFGRTLTHRLDLGAPRDGDMAEGVKLFVVGDTFSRDIGPNRSSDPFDIDGTGLTAGASFGFGNGLAGIAANYSKPRARFGRNIAKVDGETWQIGAFAGMAVLGGFAQAYLGYGRDDLDLARDGVVNPVTAETDGSHWLAGAKGGYLMPFGAMRVGPVVAIDYAKAKLDGYTEEGDPVLNLNVGSVSAKSLTGGIGAELRGDFEGGGVQLRPVFSAMLEKDLLGDGRTVRFAQTTAPGIVNSWAIEDRSKKAYGRLSAGASAAILAGATLDARMSTTVGQDDGDEVAAHVGLRIGL